MEQPRNETDVKQLVGRLLGRAPEEAIWDYLSAERDVSQVLQEDDWQLELSRLVNQYRKLEALQRSRRQSTSRAEKPPQVTPADDALKAMSHQVAKWAGQEPSVMSFRSRALDGCWPLRV